MKTFIPGLIIGFLLAPLALFFYFSSGRAPVATTDKSMPFEQLLARKALHARIDKEMPSSSPIDANESNLRSGALIYREHCALCHGLPGADPTVIAKGMFPKVPQLFHGEGVTDDPPGESYWKIKNGIRLSGMPGFGHEMSDTQLWQVSLLVSNADKLPASVASLLVPPSKK